jgi:predicted ATPase with chaperone activity
MCGRGNDSTTRPTDTPPTQPPTEPLTPEAGPFDDRWAYRVTEEGMKALEEYERANGKPAFVAEPLPDTVAKAIHAEEWRARKRRRRKQARARGRHLLTVCGRQQAGREVPDLRMTGRWLEDAGFPQGQIYEVQVEAGTLTLRAL